MGKIKILGLIFAIIVCAATVISLEHRNVSRQKDRLQSAADHAVLAAQKYAKTPELHAYTAIAKNVIGEEFDDLDVMFIDELSENYDYTVRLSTKIKFKIASFGIFPREILKSARAGATEKRNSDLEFEAILPKSDFGTRILMNLYSNDGESKFNISSNHENLSLPNILELAEKSYSEHSQPHDNSRYDVVVIATDKPIDLVSCQKIADRRATMIIHPYGSRAKEIQMSCPENMIYCCGHKIIRWNFSTDPANLKSNLFEILTGLDHLHVSC